MVRVRLALVRIFLYMIPVSRAHVILPQATSHLSDPILNINHRGTHLNTQKKIIRISRAIFEFLRDQRTAIDCFIYIDMYT